MWMDQAELEIDGRTAAVIAAGMQAVALADGEAHPRELALIAAFRSDVPEDVDPSTVVLEDDALRDVFVRFLWMVALADGAVSDPEREAILDLGRAHGVSRERIATLAEEVRREMFSMFTGVTVFRDQAIAVAESLGLAPDEAAAILDE